MKFRNAEWQGFVPGLGAIAVVCAPVLWVAARADSPFTTLRLWSFLATIAAFTVVFVALAVHAGERVFRPTITSTIRNVVRPRRRDADRATVIPALTGRELDVLRLLAGGLGNKQIAYALHLSEGTVKNHVSTILDKLQATDRTRAVLKAIERGLV
jgi:DNA-binding CsgD family transcriptional regulator